MNTQQTAGGGDQTHPSKTLDDVLRVLVRQRAAGRSVNGREQTRSRQLHALAERIRIIVHQPLLSPFSAASGFESTSSTNSPYGSQRPPWGTTRP